jgi:GTP-binding protein HflX
MNSLGFVILISYTGATLHKNELDQTIPTAVLVAVQLPDQSDDDFQGSLAELARLVKTLGFDVVGQVTQKRRKPSVSTIIGEGKLKELAAYTGGTGIVQGFVKNPKKEEINAEEFFEPDEEDLDEEAASAGEKPHASVVIFDTEITPNQLRNLEQATGCEVLDRTGVILEIFSRHAQSREAKLQVEIAKLGYLAPRLRASGLGGDRQGGGIGAKGAGETSYELDRRRIRDRIVELKSQLDIIRGKQEHNRQKRREAPTVALVGYTNAGKSSLMRALTGSEVYVADKLFATLDTRVKALQPPTVPQILVSDTVGFIKKLPHDLVASFRSTLDEALSASLLLFTVDASDPSFRSQLEVTTRVLDEIGADDVPKQFIMNKIDCLDEVTLKILKKEYPDALFISTREKNDIKKVWLNIVEFFEKDMLEASIEIPYTLGHVVNEIRKKMRIIKETYEENSLKITVKAKADMIDWAREQMKKAADQETSE